MKTLTIALVGAVLVTVCSARAHSECDSEKGEVFMTCDTACPDTCENYQEKRLCTLNCVIGCFCPNRTVRRESDGHCVKPEDC